MMGCGEVEAGVGGPLDVGVSMELSAVVGGDGVHGSRLSLDQLDGSAAQLLGRACLEFSDLEVSGLAFDEGHDAGLAVAEHGVCLPMANAGSVVDRGGSVLDRPLSGQTSSRVAGAVSLAPSLGGLSQVRVQESPVSLVVPDVSVDGLMADLEASFVVQSSGDLLGAPVLLLQQTLDQVPVLVHEPEVSS